MRPSTPELLDSVAAALEAQVLPSVQDKWAASTLRSAMQLLRFLALRVAQEPQILREQAADLHATLAQLAPLLAQPQLADLHAAVMAVLQTTQPAAHDVPGLDACCERALACAEALIAARDRLRSATGSSVVHERLVACLQRQLERERALIAPFQSTPPI